MLEAVPQELKDLRHWGCFRLQPRGGKMTKTPVNPHTGGPGKSNDESTWADFDTAVEAMQDLGCDGLGFYFKPPYFGIDLDNVEAEIKRYQQDDHDKNIVSEFIDMMGSYAEYSVSGNGIHIIAKGDLPPGGRRKGNVEMYDSGRFFAMTGKPAAGYTHIHDDSENNVINYLHTKYIQTSKVSEKHTPDTSPGHDISEERLIEIAENAKNGMRFKMFMSGGWEQFYDSQSEADMAFANDLAFWTNRDFNKMDSIFRRSSLMREKWDRKQNGTTYGAETLNKAIYECNNTFSPSVSSDDDFNIFIEDQDVKKVENRFYSYDDTGNAERFTHAYGEVVRYSYIRKGWFFYDGKVWSMDQEGRVKKLADKVIERMRNERVFVPEGTDEEAAVKQFQKHIKQTRSSRGKTAMIKESEHLLPIKQDQFDKDIDLLNTQNGYLNLDTGQLHDHDKEKYFTKISNVEYTDKSDCPLWMDFLKTIFDHDHDLIRYVQRCVGYSLSGSTEEQVLFFLHGNGSNGKSVFLDVISEIFGNYSANIQPQTIMVKQQSSNANPDIAKLAGARLVTTTEPNEGVRLDEGLVKQLTGSDKVTARFLYQDEFEFKPQFKLWMATNHKPIIRGTDDGIWRRLVIIPFAVQIPEHKKDKRLTHKLRREMSAILNWAVEGYLDWRKNGLQEPSIIKTQRQEYRTEMDTVEAFLEECCERTEDGSVQAKQLYEIYKDWADENNQYLMSSTKFGKEMKKKFTCFKSSQIYYRGVKLKIEVEKPFFRMNYS